MILIGPRLGDHVDLATAIVSILCVEVVGDDTKLGDGIEIGDHGGPVMHAFFGIGPIHHECVGSSTATVDGLLAIVQVARYLRRAHSRCGAVPAMRIRRHAGLQFQEVDVGTSVQRHGGDLRAIDEHTVLRALRLYLQSVAFHAHSVGNGSELHGDVNAERGIRVDLYPCLLVIAEAGLAGREIVRVNVKGREVIKALGVSNRSALYVRRYARGYDRNARDYGPARVSDHSRN